MSPVTEPIEITLPSTVNATEDESNDERAHEHDLSGFKLANIIAAVCLIFILVGLDSTIIATAVPTITRYFGTSADVGWYSSIYRLTASSFQFLFGKLYSLFPTKIIVITSLVIFTGSNLLCALAPTSTIFILGRAVSGFATAGMVSGAFAMIIQSIRLQKRSTYAGIGGATEALASLSAPLIGGLLTDRLTWQWCFFFQIPIAAAALIVMVLFYHESQMDRGIPERFAARVRHLGLFGTVLLVPCLTVLTLALQWGGSKYEWSDWRVLTLLGLFIVLAAAFVCLQCRQQEQATIPPRIVLQRNVMFGFLFSCCNNAALFIIEYYMPIYLQTVKGYSATISGVMVLPSAAGLVISVSSSGVLTSYFGYYNPFMISTSILTPVATGLMTTLSVDSKSWCLIFYQALLGFGTGIGFQGPQVAVQAIFAERDSQIGIAIIQFAQGIGPAIFIAAAQTIFASRLESNVQQFAPNVDEVSMMGQGLTLSGLGAANETDSSVIRGYSKSLTQTFFLSVGLACTSLIGALGMEWRSIKTKTY